MDETIPENTTEETKEEVKAVEKETRGVRENIAANLSNTIANNKYVKLYKKARTLGTIASTISALPIALPLGVGLLVLCFLCILAYIGYNAAIKIGPDTPNLLVQCQILGKPLDANCIKALIDTSGKQLAPDDESKGVIGNPNPTYQN